MSLSYHHKEHRASAGYNAAGLYVEANAYRMKINHSKAILMVLLTSIATMIYLAITLMLPEF